MTPFLPKKAEPVVFGLLLSGMMSFIVSGISTIIGRGFNAGLPLNWLLAWLPSWAIAFPAVLVVAPLVRRLVGMVVRRG